MRFSLVLLVSVLLAACDRADSPVVVHAADAVPERLSDWNLVLSDGRFLRTNTDVLPYELNTPLFSDYALKFRTVWMPAGRAAVYDASEEFEFPVGTIISKTFHYEKAADWSRDDYRVVRADGDTRLDKKGRIALDRHQMIETRLLVRYPAGWKAYPYVWNDQQTEAWLEIAGDMKRITLAGQDIEQSFVYLVPDMNQCSACHAPDHTSADIRPIGLKARHLNREYSIAGTAVNQIEHWQRAGVLTGVGDPVPAGVRWSNKKNGDLDERARAYLDINCAHCHNSAGAADTSGLHLNIDAPVDRSFGICKSPTAVGQGSGNRPYDIYPGRPDKSILLYRMQHSDPAIAMPELGRSTVHTEAVQLMQEWIRSLPGDC